MTGLRTTIDGKLLDFSDSSIVGYAKSGGDLRVRLALWDESRCELVFRRAIAVRECLASGLDCILVDQSVATALTLEAAQELSGDRSRPAPVNNFRFVDVEGRTVLEIVCEAGFSVAAVPLTESE